MDVKNIIEFKKNNDVTKLQDKKNSNIIKNSKIKDEFVKGASMSKKYSENDNIKFKQVDIQFYPEDVEKMSKMSLEEKINFIRELKALNRYIEVNDSSKIVE